MDRFRLGWHPIAKGLLYFQVVLLSMYGSHWASVLVAFSLLASLLLYRGDKGTVASPVAALAFCALSVIVVVPGGTLEELKIAGVLSVRILGVMVGSMALGLVLTRRDIQYVGSVFHLPNLVIESFGGLVFFVPVAVRSLQNVIRAQQSRGFEFKPNTMLRLRTYRALVVPYIISVLQSALSIWISINLRPSSAISDNVGRITGPELLALGLTALLWFIR
jgi:energy-coupling factor transporter transmembrane protein EcfT